MNLDRLNSGKKLIEKVVSQGNTKNMRWTRSQQQEMLDQKSNYHTPKSRPGK